MQLDKDLLSAQEARSLALQAKEAQKEFKHYTQNQVDAIVKAIYEAGYAAAEQLAKMAAEESGFGKWQDKVTKNKFATKNVYESIKDLKTVGVIETEQQGKLLKIAEPMGVVAALIPSTNPTSTAMFKAIISLKGRNAIVASPHPRTTNCTIEALRIMAQAAEKAGAPRGLIQCMTTPTIEGTQALMKDKNIAVILATGSTPMVKSAYSSGTPAYGVGSGNVPAFIEQSANIKKAVADIFYGTTFDNGTLCSSEQSMIVDKPIAAQVRAEALKQGGYFVNAEEKAKLEKTMFPEGHLNPAIVGQSAQFIAEKSGFKVADTVRVLLADCKEIGKSEPLSREKLSPVLAYYEAAGWLDGCHKSIDLLNFGGVGHTMVIHSNNQEIIMKFALEKPAFRIVANSVSALGAVGYTTALLPSLTLGPGTWGGSIVSENVSAKHLINIKYLAFETTPINQATGTSVSSMQGNEQASSFMTEIDDRLRARAGNPPVNFSVFTPSENKNKKKTEEISYGTSGITETEILKIIKDFKNH